MTKHEYLFSKEREPGILRVKIEAASAGNNTIVAAVAGKKIRVYQVLLVAAGAVNADFQSGAGGTDLTGPLTLTTNVGFSSGWNPVGHFETAEGALLNMVLSGATGVGGWLTYALV